MDWTNPNTKVKGKAFLRNLLLHLFVDILLIFYVNSTSLIKTKIQTRHSLSRRRTMKLARSILGVTTLASTARGFLPASVHHATSIIQQPSSFFQQPARDFSIFSQAPDYAERQANFGMADKAVLAETAKLQDVVFVDARGAEEIAELSLDRHFVHGNFILNGKLDHLHQILPSRSAHIIVFCKMGGRAAKVKATLEQEGYKNVLNAGGISDVDFLE